MKATLAWFIDLPFVGGVMSVGWFIGWLVLWLWQVVAQFVRSEVRNTRICATIQCRRGQKDAHILCVELG